MRIALALERYDPLRGGAEQWAFQWTSWLLSNGHQVDIVASEFRNTGGQDRLTLHAIGPASSRYDFGERVGRYLDGMSVDLVHDLGVGWRYDLIQPHFGTRLVDYRQNLKSLPRLRRLSAALSKRSRKRLRDLRRLEALQYSGSSGKIVAVSHLTRAHLIREHRISPERLTVIHNGIDTMHFRPADGEERSRLRAGFHDGPLLLFAAHNFRLKGLTTVLRALAKLPSPRPRLVVAGRGQIDEYKALAKSCGVLDRVTFVGFVADMREQYSAADMLVHPTFYDPCSLVVLEAAACGLPVITSSCCGASEFFEDRVSAHIVRDPADPAEMASRIQSLMDPDGRARMGRASRAAVQEATADRSFSRLFALCEAIHRSKAAR